MYKGIYFVICLSLPAYPGFMVIKTEQVGSSLISVPSKRSTEDPELMPLWIVRICCATTESTSRSILLNSSKQDHAPHDASPLKNFPRAM